MGNIFSNWAYQAQPLLILHTFHWQWCHTLKLMCEKRNDRKEQREADMTDGEAEHLGMEGAGSLLLEGPDIHSRMQDK